MEVIDAGDRGWTEGDNGVAAGQQGENGMQLKPRARLHVLLGGAPSPPMFHAVLRTVTSRPLAGGFLDGCSGIMGEQR